MTKPEINVYLIGEGALWRAELLDDNDRLPWGHQLVDTVEQADVAFAWFWRAKITPFTSFALGMAYASSKPIYGGAIDEDALYDAREAVHDDDVLVRIGDGYKSARDAYENVLADIDVTLPENYKLTTATTCGNCKGCGGMFGREDRIRKSARQGSYHADCYARLKDPAAVDAALFTSALVESLRVENVALEKRVFELSPAAKSSETESASQYSRRRTNA